MTRKYVVIPGEVRSRTDGDIHYISASRLMELYGVSPNQCYVVCDERDEAGLPKGLIRLYPRYKGDYNLPTEEPNKDD